MFHCTGDTRTPCIHQQCLDICTSNPRANKWSGLIRSCRPMVYFHSTCSASSILRLSHDLEVRESYCWRALAWQLPILYNREKKAQSVGCKIGDLRSKFTFNIRGLLNVETCVVDYGCFWMHVELSIHFKRKEGQDKGGEFLHLCR